MVEVGSSCETNGLLSLSSYSTGKHALNRLAEFVDIGTIAATLTRSMMLIVG